MKAHQSFERSPRTVLDNWVSEVSLQGSAGPFRSGEEDRASAVQSFDHRPLSQIPQSGPLFAFVWGRSLLADRIDISSGVWG